MNDRTGKARDLKRALDKDPWVTEATAEFGPSTRYYILALDSVVAGYSDDCFE